VFTTKTTFIPVATTTNSSRVVGRAIEDSSQECTSEISVYLSGSLTVMTGRRPQESTLSGPPFDAGYPLLPSGLLSVDDDEYLTASCSVQAKALDIYANLLIEAIQNATRDYQIYSDEVRGCNKSCDYFSKETADALVAKWKIVKAAAKTQENNNAKCYLIRTFKNNVQLSLTSAIDDTKNFISKIQVCSACTVKSCTSNNVRGVANCNIATKGSTETGIAGQVSYSECIDSSLKAIQRRGNIVKNRVKQNSKRSCKYNDDERKYTRNHRDDISDNMNTLIKNVARKRVSIVNVNLVAELKGLEDDMSDAVKILNETFTSMDANVTLQFKAALDALYSSCKVQFVIIENACGGRITVILKVAESCKRCTDLYVSQILEAQANHYQSFDNCVRKADQKFQEALANINKTVTTLAEKDFNEIGTN